jgi:16S rRNA processing protein RimM
LIIVGEISKPHGIRGDVRVVPVTDFPDHLLRLPIVAIVRGNECRRAGVERAQASGRFVIMKLEGVDTVEAAQALRGATLRIRQQEVLPLSPGQFYVYEIVGLRVRTPEGEPLGVVVDVLRTGSNDVYVIRPAGGPDILLPALDSVIVSIDIEAGVIVARPPHWA